MPVINRNAVQQQEAMNVQCSNLPQIGPIDAGIQLHTHELVGSVKLTAEMNEGAHNHRFATVTGPAIRVQGGHVHLVEFTTDFYDHYHKFVGFTEVETDINNNKHVHEVRGLTNIVDGHIHRFDVATLVESPLLPNVQLGDEC